MAVLKSLLTEFDIHYRLESCDHVSLVDDIKRKLFQAVLVILDTLVSSKPKRLLQCWPAFAFTTIYVTFNATYVLSGGTDPEGNPYIYNGLKWNENVLTALITGVNANATYWFAFQKKLIWVTHISAK